MAAIRAWLVLLALGWVAPLLCSTRLIVAGRVVDETGAPVAGARVLLGSGSVRHRTESGEAGAFELREVEPGTYELRVEKSGFYVLVNREFQAAAGAPQLDLVLNHQQEYEERVDVVYSAPAIDVQQVTSSASLTANEIVDLPYPSSHQFRNGLATLPGVVQDRRGKIHLSGGAEDQVLYVLNGFHLANPYNGALDHQIPVDGIRRIDLQSSRYAAEFGKGSAGTLAIESGAGDDQYRFSATNFVPSTQIGGPLISSWTPRGAISGPWRRGRAWFFNAADARLNINDVDDLPPGENRNTRWVANNLLRNDLLVARGTSISTTFLFNHHAEDHFGLSPRDPLETTTRYGLRNYFFAIKVQHYLEGRGILLDGGLAATRLNTRSDPLGDLPFRITPDGQQGNFFERSRLRARREQVTLNALLPARNWRGRHEWKVGGDFTWVSAARRLERRPFELFRSDETLWRRTVFNGPRSYARGSAERSFYLQDRWLPSERVVVEFGARYDWNRLAERGVVSPRVAVALAPFGAADTKVTVGLGLFHDTLSLEMLTRGDDQFRDEYNFSDDGLEVVSILPTRFLLPAARLRLPRTRNFSAGLEQRLPAGFYLRTTFLSRRTSRGLAYLDSPAEGAYILGNRRRDRYDSLEIKAERGLGKGYRWMGAYTRSSARSNAVLNVAITNPIFGVQGEGPLDWDAPHRFISSAWMPVGQKYGVAWLVEWRSGYPFSIISERSGLVGPPNSQRYPDYFSLNLEVERRFRFRKYLWGFRFGFINLTGHKNPNSVNSTLESPNFRNFSGGQKRAFVTRIRLIGKG